MDPPLRERAMHYVVQIVQTCLLLNTLKVHMHYKTLFIKNRI